MDLWHKLSIEEKKSCLQKENTQWQILKYKIIQLFKSKSSHSKYIGYTCYQNIGWIPFGEKYNTFLLYIK